MKQRNKASGSPKSFGQRKGKGNRMRHRIGRKPRWKQLKIPFPDHIYIRDITGKWIIGNTSGFGMTPSNGFIEGATFQGKY
jgi:hypothetical protein